LQVFLNILSSTSLNIKEFEMAPARDKQFHLLANLEL